MYMRGMTGKWNAMWHSSDVAEIRPHVARPLVRFGEKDPVRELRVERGAKLAQHVVRLRKILAVRALALDEIRNGVESQPVDAHAQPEAHDVDDRLEHVGIVEVEVGLVAEEAMPVELLRLRIPRPVRALGVGEDDARVRRTCSGRRSTRTSCARAIPSARGARAGTTDAGPTCG